MKWLSKKSLLICLTLLMLVVVVVSMIVTTGMPVREDAVNMVLEKRPSQDTQVTATQSISW